MRFLFVRLLTAFSITLLISACGGGGSTAGPDTQKPVISAVTAQAVTGATATLQVSASDDVGVTGYCFKTTSTTPSATDVCFQASAQKAAAQLISGTTQYVWAKDAAGNVSLPARGPCSAAGYTASDSSPFPTVCMMTDKGEIVVELNDTKAPISVANFLAYANAGFYGNTTFHRVMSNFMIQGGGFTVSGVTYSPKATNAPITLERTTLTGLSNTRGTIAMARQTAADTATSQFFINVVDNLSLNFPGPDNTGGYAVFGSVIKGLDVVDLIKSVPVISNGSELSLPATPLLIQWAYPLK